MGLGAVLFNSSVTIKLQRADEHLAGLRADIAAKLKSDRTRIVPRFNTDFKEAGFYLEFRKPHPGGRWSAIIGDIAHNLRCALDHVVYAAAASRHNKIPPPYERFLNFPIASKPENLTHLAHLSHALDDKVLDIIKAEQPYKRGTTFMLPTLQRINNHDKHRSVTIAPVAMSGAHLTNFSSYVGKILRIEVLDRPLIHSGPTPLPMLKVVFSEPNPKFKCDAKASICIMLFDGVSWLNAIDAMQDCRDEVSRIVDRLRPYLK